jgi:photosystem II stability/assembly factor-like uncharacterized protein
MCYGLCGQEVKLLTSGMKVSIRGLSVVDDRTVWVSGSNGMVGRSADSGNTWKWMTVKGFEKTEFRDIEAFDDMTAVIMGIDSPAYILRTIDGGETWKVVFENHSRGIFLDAMEFWNEQSGVVLGDPIDKRFFIARTFDGGDTWEALPVLKRPQADSGEACFASSGTNIRILNKKEAVFVSGGLQSRLFLRAQRISLPLINGKESTGANSLAVKNKKTMIVAGGDFSTKDSVNGNCVITRDGGKTWTYPAEPPHGYRSCIEFLDKNNWITCGLSGVDISSDDGLHFRQISNTSFHVCRKAKKGKVVFLAGGGGRIAKLIF